MKTKIVIVIPAYNEHKFLSPLIKNIRKYSKLPIVVVDDGSQVPLKVSNCHLLRHKINLGKGAAMITGADYAFNKLGATHIIFMDGDGQHDPKHLSEFIEHIKKGIDIVFGSRGQSRGVPMIRYLGNKFASVYINLLFGVYVSDILSGFRSLSKRAYHLLKWDSIRYGVETEMVARLSRHSNMLKFAEIPISTIYIDKYKGVSILDAVKILANSIWWKLY